MWNYFIIIIITITIGGGGGGGGGVGCGGGGLLIDAVSNTEYITSNDGILNNEFEWTLKNTVVAMFKTASNVRG